MITLLRLRFWRTVVSGKLRRLEGWDQVREDGFEVFYLMCGVGRLSFWNMYFIDLNPTVCQLLLVHPLQAYCLTGPLSRSKVCGPVRPAWGDVEAWCEGGAANTGHYL